MTRTRTHTTFFDHDQVDELVGGAYKALAEDYELRRPHIDQRLQSRFEARLNALRVAWFFLLEDAD